MIPRPNDYESPQINPMSQENRRDYWRWHFAGLVMTHAYLDGHIDTFDGAAHAAVMAADALIKELEK